jgi:hypothetical protein
MTPQVLDAALADVPEITRIEIEIIGDGFRWSLFEDERRIFAGRGDRREVRTMARCSEMLVNAMLGVLPRERWGPGLN